MRGSASLPISLKTSLSPGQRCFLWRNPDRYSTCPLKFAAHRSAKSHYCRPSDDHPIASKCELRECKPRQAAQAGRLSLWISLPQAQEFRALEGEEHAGLDGPDGSPIPAQTPGERILRRHPLLQNRHATDIAGALFHQQFHASAHDDVKRRAIIACRLTTRPAGCSSVRSKVRVSASTSSDIP